MHVNLLVEAERRDPNIMLLRTTLGALSILAVGTLALYGLFVFDMLRDVKQRQHRLQVQWEMLADDHDRATQLQAARDELARVAADLAAFSNVQVHVASRLLALAQCVPADVQLTEVVLQHAMTQEDDRPARRYDWLVTGRTAADQGEKRVRNLIEALQQAPPPDDFGDVVPGGIRIAPQSGAVMTSIFDIRCRLLPRRFP
jgi:hypothetical protein